MNSAPVVTTLAAVLPIQRPPSPATIAAISGRKTISVERVHQPRIRLTSSTAIEPRRRKKMTRMASPIAASAAATVSTNIASTWPVKSPR